MTNETTTGTTRLGDIAMESVATHPPAGALTYEGWVIRPFGSGFFLVTPEDRYAGVFDSLEGAFLTLLEIFGVDVPGDHELGAGVTFDMPEEEGGAEG